MASEGKLQANIQRLKEEKTDNLGKMDEASKTTEEKHYRMLTRKNQKMIDRYKDEIRELKG